MQKLLLALVLMFPCNALYAWPTQAEVFMLNESIVQVFVETKEGNLGAGSGVVVNGNFVATNCHVLANARGATIAKYHENYKPVALRADWKHDLCLLRFDSLPFKSIEMVDSATLKYEQPVFSIGYPNDNQVPQTSFGTVQALYPYDQSLIIRTSTAFAMGSSGGALFDEQFRLIGITTFKSPGRNGYFYSLPVEWIRKLLDAPDQQSLVSTDDPFWSLPEKDRPYFMQVVIPFQKKKWRELQLVSRAWSQQETANAEAWYYLAMSEYYQHDTQHAAEHLATALRLNQMHIGALTQSAIMANEQGNKAEALRLASVVTALDEDEGQALNKAINPAATQQP